MTGPVYHVTGKPEVKREAEAIVARFWSGDREMSFAMSYHEALVLQEGIRRSVKAFFDSLGTVIPIDPPPPTKRARTKSG